ncbi:hypothetical protein BDN72DRAFT_891236 [Pluteus cervinus]|uniref:Uncharacterized protein n=1 Tax=Pluteus cervinus TaxID=181527 RepID=A0ACD3BIH4_9AGAR|nr:hypothetical protein BDN72DRAFT_891236 [Pluteus cervinus]
MAIDMIALLNIVFVLAQAARVARATPEKFVLPNPPSIPPGPLFDATATRAATGAQIRNAANPNLCFDVSDFRAGDSRFNLVPVALKPCDSTVDGQMFDLITKGQHNNVPDGSRTIIVSTQQLTCVDRTTNINDRTRPGLFACGGRAAGDGETTADQQYFFNSDASLTGGIGFPLAQNAQNNGVGDGNQCLTLDNDGFLINTSCSPPNFTPEQTWFIEEPGTAAQPPHSQISKATSAAVIYGPILAIVVASFVFAFLFNYFRQRLGKVRYIRDHMPEKPMHPFQPSAADTRGPPPHRPFRPPFDVLEVTTEEPASPTSSSISPFSPFSSTQSTQPLPTSPPPIAAPSRTGTTRKLPIPPVYPDMISRLQGEHEPPPVYERFSS